MKREDKPLSPSELEASPGEHIPTVVIRAVNNLLQKHYRNGYATFLQKDVISEIRQLDSSISKTMIFDNHWLDFEPLFEKEGWVVEYDRPGYCESYEPSFTFSKK